MVRPVLSPAERDLKRLLEGRTSLSAAEFGATGDGSNDDTAALQRALDVAAESKVPLYLGPGTFKTTGTLYYNSRQVIRGSGPFKTRIEYSGSGTAMANGVGNRVYQNVFEDFAIVDSSGTGSLGLSWDALSLGRLSNVQVDGFDVGVNLHGGSASGGSTSLYNQFYALEVKNSGSFGVLIEEQSNSNSFWGCRIDSCDVGVEIVRANHVVITGSTFENCASFGLRFNDVSSPHIWLNSVIANRFEQNGVAWQTSTTTDQTVFLANHYDGNSVSDLGTKTFRFEARGLSFWGGTGYQSSQPSVSGTSTRDVLDSLLGVLGTYGLVADSSTADTGAWTAWSPTFTGITAGNGTVSARYRIDGRTLHWHYQLALGSTSAVGTNPKLSTPSGWKVYNAGNTVQTYALGKAFAYDSSAGTFFEGGCYGSDSTDNVLTTRIIFGSTTVNAAAPFTWASGDLLVVSGTCEVEPA